MSNARPGGFRLFALVFLLLGAACGQNGDDGTATGPDVETLAGVASTSTADPLAVQTSGSFGDAESPGGTADNAAAMGSSTTAPGGPSTDPGPTSSSAPPSTSSPGASAPVSTAPSNQGSTPTTAAPSTSTTQTTAGPTTTVTQTTARPTTTVSQTTATPTTAAPTTTTATETRCLVRLHGKGGNGRATGVYGNGIRQVRPQGNSQAWGGHQWLYFPESGYAETVGIVTSAVNAEGCTDIVLNGFSNGAAFAAKLYCRGESFGGRLRGVVIDDPVPDHGTANCSPAGGVRRVLYWTGDLANAAPAGTDCGRIDWTCDGGSSVGIDSYAQRLGTPITPSPFSDHQWYWDAPQVTSFFD